MKGKYKESEMLLRKGLITSEKIYGKEHHDYAMKLGNLAMALAAQVRPPGSTNRAYAYKYLSRVRSRRPESSSKYRWQPRKGLKEAIILIR